MKYCECGCGQEVKPKKRFISGHNGVLNKGKSHPAWNKGIGKLKTPPQLCECGCGRMTKEGNKYINHHVRYQSEETKKKISESLKIVMNQPEVKKKHSKSLKLAYSNPKIKKRQSEQTKNSWQNLEIRKKRIIGLTIANNNFESRKKKSEQMKIIQNQPEVKKKKSERMKKENHFNWRGGISKLPYSFDWTETLKEAIRQRDGYRCQVCCIVQEKLIRKLDVHHIDYDKENCDPENLISLCQCCHIKTNYNRSKWILFFNGRKKENKVIKI